MGASETFQVPLAEESPGRRAGSTAAGAPMRRSDYFWCYAFVLPFMVFFLAFTVWPLLGTVVFSFFDYDGVRPLQEYIGLANYAALFRDTAGTFPRSIANTFYFAITNSLIKHPLTFAMALLLTRKWLKGKGTFRTMFFLAFLIPVSVVGLVFNSLLHPASGALNTLLIDLGLITRGINFYGGRQIGMTTMVLISVWQIFAQYLLWWMTALQNVPEELYEVAEIDGANEWQKLRYVTLPIIRPMAIIFVFLGFINATHQLDLVLNTTGGGPGSATYTVDFFIYNRAFQAVPARYGLASAAALTFGVITLILVAIQGYFVSRAQRTRSEYGV